MYHRVDWVETEPDTGRCIAVMKCGMKVVIPPQKARELSHATDAIILTALGGPYYCPDCFADNTIGGSSAAAELGPLESDDPTTPVEPHESPYASYL